MKQEEKRRSDDHLYDRKKERKDMNAMAAGTTYYRTGDKSLMSNKHILY